MEYVIAVYRSRNVSMQAYNYILSKGITCSLISTPRQANVGCGLSVKFGRSDLPAVRDKLSEAETFVGFYLARQAFNGIILSRI